MRAGARRGRVRHGSRRACAPRGLRAPCAPRGDAPEAEPGRKPRVGSPVVRTLIRRLPFFYGWVIVACVFGSNGARQAAAVATLSVFILPMSAEFGWSRSALSGAVSLGSLLGAVVAPALGPLFDRHGSRAILVTSAVVVAGCCVALAGTPSLAWFYVSFALSRMMFSAPFDVGVTSAVAKWFVRERTLPMSFVAMSHGVFLAVIPFIAQMIIVEQGWRAGWIALAILVVVIGVVPQALLLVRQPEDVGLVPDGRAPPRSVPHASTGAGAAAAPAAEPAFTRDEAMRSPVLWLLMAYTLLVFPVQAGISLHQAPYLIERGMSPAVAASAISIFSLSSAFAALALGLTGRRVPARGALVACAALLALATLGMREADSPIGAFCAAAAFGASLGGIFVMLPLAWADYFGRAHFGAIRGITLPAQVGGQALGPVLAGVLHDVTGDYGAGLAVFALFAMAAAVLALFVRAPRYS